MVATFGPPLVSPYSLHGLASEPLTIAVSAIGLIVVVSGKLSLGRSFGAGAGQPRRGQQRRLPRWCATRSISATSSPTWDSCWPTRRAGASSSSRARTSRLMLRAECEERTLSADEAYRSSARSASAGASCPACSEENGSRRTETGFGKACSLSGSRSGCLTAFRKPNSVLRPPTPHECSALRRSVDEHQGIERPCENGRDRLGDESRRAAPSTRFPRNSRFRAKTVMTEREETDPAQPASAMHEVPRPLQRFRLRRGRGRRVYTGQ